MEVPRQHTPPKSAKLALKSDDSLIFAKFSAKSDSGNSGIPDMRTLEVDIDMGVEIVQGIEKGNLKGDTDAELGGLTTTYHVLMLIKLVLTHSELQKLIKDFSVVGRDLAVRVIAPSADQLKDVNEVHSVSDEERLETWVPKVNG
ncbi:hypothetical protein EV421DRAFT_1738886 [Armillaria borealis]|uniref:HAM1-like N-terminal domain-containing protein n=1 Tax=Armillaria borealis TaxID=47425 RepID=A0AA39J8H3_9AGAR|nr:hypothetical protein EV421DRAFT_1738886 [Armillaria borealis]